MQRFLILLSLIAHRHLALNKLKVIYGDQKTVELFLICETLDKRYTTSLSEIKTAIILAKSAQLVPFSKIL